MKLCKPIDPNLKIGITNSVDFEIQFNGLESFDSSTGASVARGTGFGDVSCARKINLFGNDSGPWFVLIIPCMSTGAFLCLASSAMAPLKAA